MRVTNLDLLLTPTPVASFARPFRVRNTQWCEDRDTLHVVMEVPYASYQPGSTALTSPGSRRGDARTPEARLQITAAGGSRHRRDDPVRGRALDRDIGGEGSGVIEAAPASGPTRRGPR